MSMAVRIIDTETGEVLLDVSDATCAMGVIVRNGEEHIPGEREHMVTKQFSYVRCNMVSLYRAITGLRGVIVATQTKFPKVNNVGEILNLLKGLDDEDGD